jgi:hypothetical protein
VEEQEQQVHQDKGMMVEQGSERLAITVEEVEVLEVLVQMEEHQLLDLVALVFNFLHHLEIQYHLQVQQVVVWVCLVHLVLIGLLAAVVELRAIQEQQITMVLVEDRVDHMLVAEMVKVEVFLYLQAD